jgi:hypothetical protein
MAHKSNRTIILIMRDTRGMYIQPKVPISILRRPPFAAKGMNLTRNQLCQHLNISASCPLEL